MSRQRGRPVTRESILKQQAMAHLYRSGATLQEIGDVFGVTRQAVQLRVIAKGGLTKHDGGVKVAIKQRRQERQAKEEAIQ